MDNDVSLTLPDGWEDLDYDLRVTLLAAQNKQADIRDAVDAMIHKQNEGNPSNVRKEWLAAVLLALGGPEEVHLDG